MDNNEFPKSYYSIIPASVRYDKELSDKAKLLYGEISALCNEQGYCWATNSYFAELYEVTRETISRLIKQLSDKNYIYLEFEIDNSRKIYLQCSYEYKHEISIPLLTKKSIGIDENINSIKNNTINTIKEKEIYKEKEKAQRLKDQKTFSSNNNKKEREITPPKEKEKDSKVGVAREVIAYLNEKAGKRYSDVPSNTKIIVARLNEKNYKLEDFKNVIDKKVEQWGNSTMDQYLRPSTLFAPSHFEDYLNESSVEQKKEESGYEYL
jgi:uncharacterized phage protein (TIGR02220 family)